MLPDVIDAAYGEDEEEPPGSEQEDQLAQDQGKLRSGRSVFTEQLCELPPHQWRKTAANPKEQHPCAQNPRTKHQAIPQGPFPIAVSGIRCVQIFLVHAALFFLFSFLDPMAPSPPLHCT